jgi:pimeloyl-ACP methyl ester carboxylesterase
LITLSMLLSVLFAYRWDEKLSNADYISEDPLVKKIRDKGYQTEIYGHKSGDGDWWLWNIRIPNPGKPPLVMLHGLGGGLYTYTGNENTKAIAYLLHDAGYDIWLPQFRNGELSYNIYYTRNDSAWYDYDWHEMGTIDLPGFINQTLKETGKSKVTVVGHSMGSTAFYAGASTMPDYYNDKVELFMAIPPIVLLMIDFFTNIG